MAKKRAPSAYNRHVGREMKAGRSMKQAAASWKRKGTSTRKASKTRKRSSSKSKTSTRRNSGMRLGGFSPMGIVKAAALYIGTTMAIFRVAPQIAAVPGGVEAAAGGIAMATGLPGVAFVALGAAKFVGSYALRIFNGGGIGNGGGYDY